MALIQCNFNSRSLMRTVPLQVVLPTDKIMFPGQPEAEEKPFKTLYLLHGIFGNYTDWVAGTRIQSWAQNRDLCVVMPSGDNSFYVDNRKTSAIVNGLQHPETFGHVIGLSAALVLNEQNLNAEYTDFLMTNRGYYESVFGDLDKVLGGENDYTALAERGANREDKPRMYLACGTEDGLIAPNYQFRDKLIELGYDVTWAEGPGGHDWDFWDEYILKALEWLPLGDVTQGISSGHVSED